MAVPAGGCAAARVERWFETGAARFPMRRESLILLLQAAQAEFGFLPRETLAGIARRLRMPAATVQGIATFYAQFRFHPPGKHVLTVCRGTACHVRGAGMLLDEMASRLQVRPRETTADGLFSLEAVACVGSCALAPVVIIDGKFYSRQTGPGLRKTVEGIRAASREEG
ncbi:MAG: NAD(P)H-dependent oxidoreductase subunit E [Myxococcota bacterium]|nr:NAD(P)H-dependent oxidoreductase subunit E [Myxococcota bacterium]